MRAVGLCLLRADAEGGGGRGGGGGGVSWYPNRVCITVKYKLFLKFILVNFANGSVCEN